MGVRDCCLREVCNTMDSIGGEGEGFEVKVLSYRGG